ncbi:hypothetical protein [Candidatus Nitronereus thalassa]|uniref:DUF4145 domain-containing protein n=1 Tax=Candidatus Nitronereus thalassa TaxID=3020898 RepID=A0ABU3K8I2_9BACT|nr:hypothetical protein [Candidatus Nitronereus thalassa]MDT7042669.1 hypothetical protein [Candidatus Nitronereus thalassa]
MSLDDILKIIEGENEEEISKIRKSLDHLRRRLEVDPAGVSQEDVIEGIINRFGLVGTSDFLEDSPWLIKALHFTSRPISNEQIRSAWEDFFIEEAEESHIILDDYPILESIAWWYFLHRNDPALDGEENMIRRALAVFEALVLAVRGYEGEADYEDVLSGNGLTILHLYFYGLKDFERAKFYAQLLEMEYRACRMVLEDYLQVRDVYEKLVKKEKEKHTTIDTLFLLQWDTIAAREREIRELDKKFKQLLKERREQIDLKGAEFELRETYGATWNELHDETKKQIILASAFIKSTLANKHPFVIPWTIFKAINSELLMRLFEPIGLLKNDILNYENGTSPASLLIKFRMLEIGSRAPDVDSLIRNALNSIGGQDKILSFDDLEHLKFLRKHRNSAEHGTRRPYTDTDMKKLARDVWESGWLLNWLKRLSQG